MFPTRARRPRDHSVVVSRFAEACEADDRIVAGLLGGSRARGQADEFSDVDLCAIGRLTTTETVNVPYGIGGHRLT